jgi:hypothetical protein
MVGEVGLSRIPSPLRNSYQVGGFVVMSLAVAFLIAADWKEDRELFKAVWRVYRAGAKEFRLLQVLESFVPERVAREEGGDLLERIAQWNSPEWRWKRRRVIAQGMFWILVNGGREYMAILMKRLFRLGR